MVSSLICRFRMSYLQQLTQSSGNFRRIRTTQILVAKVACCCTGHTDSHSLHCRIREESFLFLLRWHHHHRLLLILVHVLVHVHTSCIVNVVAYRLRLHLIVHNVSSCIDFFWLGLLRR